jgi:hypothetical protein
MCLAKKMSPYHSSIFCPSYAVKGVALVKQSKLLMYHILIQYKNLLRVVVLVDDWAINYKRSVTVPPALSVSKGIGIIDLDAVKSEYD